MSQKIQAKVAKLLKSELLVLPAFLEFYNSFDTLLVCFCGLMNNLFRQQAIFQKLVFLKTGILESFSKDDIQQFHVAGLK